VCRQGLFDHLLVRYIVRTVLIRYRWNFAVGRFVAIAGASGFVLSCSHGISPVLSNGSSMASEAAAGQVINDSCWRRTVSPDPCEKQAGTQPYRARWGKI